MKAIANLKHRTFLRWSFFGDTFNSGLGFICIVYMILIACSAKQNAKPDNAIFCLPIMAGEVSHESVILFARLTSSDSLVGGDLETAEGIATHDLPGEKGVACFEIADNKNFDNLVKTGWQNAEVANDFIVKKKIDWLAPNIKYFYRVRFGTDSLETKTSKTQIFSTLPIESSQSDVEFIMGACSHFERFYLGGGFGKASSQGEDAYQGDDKFLGFKALETIAEMKPLFFVSNGDNVYYDHPEQTRATDQDAMRKKWHRQFSLPRMQNLFESVPIYFIKDDHDYRFDDADTTSAKLPTGSLGIKTFVEQVPIVDPQEVDAKTYRTYKVNELLQIWMLEGRDYRSPNKMEDGSEKSIWGIEQKEWLKRSLLESTEKYKILISPTPMVGPDDASKSDNHTNFGGFRHERDEFFRWLNENDFLNKNLYILCGDRHWQYHSIDPSGFEEFSCGALVDQNSRIGRLPGDPKSTDPDKKIKQPYTQTEPSGGFLKVRATKDAIIFSFYDELGKELYTVSK